MRGWTLQKPPGRSWDGAGQKDERQLAWVEKRDGHPVTCPCPPGWGTGCPERLSSLHLQRFSSLNWMKPWEASPDLEANLLQAGGWTRDLLRSHPPWVILWWHHEISVPSFKCHQDGRMLKDHLDTCMTYWVERRLDRKTTLVHKPCFLLKPGWGTASLSSGTTNTGCSN